ncbi:Sugar (and other) transporter family protein [Clavispora lusitaniae]|uniref:Major facilitator superfamily (MFS) profile domain-containing protein n=1 Tax=Clavispora lusitaniae (strain ATCC 42720) TaxID=306902 RepID=C4Y737_CLAL4|nr:uncharacterized protein CLUG_03971 [Clavispora lusitaniae ATCC 42720]EEQ39843.1 hypothetical protein CLUG_03971 [Clavispora lusitaniae ATCC 42720]KAF7582192.1 Sugar (and other) transporter family protein [Clavispora lusitaniae]
MKVSVKEKITPIVQKKKFRWTVEDHDSPKEIYNWTLYLTVFVFGVLGAARGLDEGNISGNVAQPSFISQFGLADKTKSSSELADRKSNITSMVQLGSVGGALVAMYTVDKLGRINALRFVCCIWIVGAIIQITSHSVGQLYAGRAIEGLAIGQTTTIGPAYLSEVAPRQIRGLCGCIFAGAVYFGIMLSYFANYGTALHISNTSRNQWVIPTTLKIIFAGLILIMSFLFCYESPRWLIKVNRPDDAIDRLSKIRNLPKDHPYIVGEISDINEQIMTEKEAVEGNSAWSMLKELLMVKANRYRFFVVAVAAQVLGQWSGSNAITIYAPELFAVVGITGVDKLKMTAVLGVVKFVSAYLSAFFIVDIFGRRAAMYSGISLQLASELYFAIFMNVVPEAQTTGNLHGSKKNASRGALAAIFLSGCGWTMGFNSIQYLLGSEIFPLNIRSLAQSMVMVLHFANQYGNSKALPKMMIAMKAYGAFYLFSGVLAVSLFWVWFFVPEVAGRSLESMDEIFNLPWYLIGRRGPELCPDHSELNRIHYNNGSMVYDESEPKPTSNYVEDINDVHEDKGDDDGKLLK